MAPTLGQHLRHAREQRGWKIEDIAHITRIPARHLRELEADDLTGCGGLVYARSFLKTYAKQVAVDASEVLSQIRIPPLGGTRDYRYLLENLGQWVDDPRLLAMVPPKRSISTPRTFGFVAVLVMICLLGGVALWRAEANARNSATALAKTAAAAPAGGHPSELSHESQAGDVPLPSPASQEDVKPAPKEQVEQKVIPKAIPVK